MVAVQPELVKVCWFEAFDGDTVCFTANVYFEELRAPFQDVEWAFIGTLQRSAMSVVADENMLWCGEVWSLEA